MTTDETGGGNEPEGAPLPVEMMRVVVGAGDAGAFDETLPLGPDADFAPEDLLTLERYVELTAELRGAADSIMRKFGLEDPKRRRFVQVVWRARLEGNPELQAKFEKLVEEKMASAKVR